MIHILEGCARVQQTQGQNQSRQKFLNSMSTLAQGIQNLAMAELTLFKEDLRASTLESSKKLIYFFISIWVASLGLLPLLGFLVITLGSSLNESYALSCLIVSVLFMSLGLGLSYYFIRSIMVTKQKTLFRSRPSGSGVLIFNKTNPDRDATPKTNLPQKRAAS